MVVVVIVVGGSVGCDVLIMVNFGVEERIESHCVSCVIRQTEVISTHGRETTEI